MTDPVPVPRALLEDALKALSEAHADTPDGFQRGYYAAVILRLAQLLHPLVLVPPVRV
jgi:hypothetical protein